MSSKLYLGIDLGTTNSSISYLMEGDGQHPEVIDIPQVLKPGVVTQQSSLPSALYIPFQSEFESTEFGLPFQVEKSEIIGQYAKDRSFEVPDRVVISAKSWLCQSHTDRKANILPWKSEIPESKISPFCATSSYLSYMKKVIEHVRESNNFPKDLDLVITVPASFDEVARSLTVEAAKQAGITQFSLLEEPLAAFYSWLASQGDNWRNELNTGDVVLVCDIGGGTADFTLIYIGEESGNLSLIRLSVGEHLLLGGDNMDLALAHVLRQKIEDTGKEVDHWQFQSLIHQSRLAKERILSEDIESLPVTIVGKGSSLFATTIRVDLLKTDVLQIVLDGFFPKTSYHDAVVISDDLGITEEGLPYEAEPAITKHLGEFIRRSAYQISTNQNLGDDLKRKSEHGAVFPNVILFNGGVCSSHAIKERILETLRSWSSSELRELETSSLHTAVSKGASYYAKIKASGKGVKIKAGTSRSYYLGLKSAAMAIPGMKPSIRGLCVVPQGMEEGSETTVSDQVFNLLTGREVTFRLFTSNARGSDVFGDIVENAEKLLSETAHVSLTLPHASTHTVPVKLYSKVNELGILELWMKSTQDDQQWKLQFDIRAEKKTLGAEKLSSTIAI